MSKRLDMETVDEYRSLISATDLRSTRIRIKESDLLIRMERECSIPARKALLRYREAIENYLALHPGFQESLVPLSAEASSHPIIVAMTRAAFLCGVGPMAAVAGALAYFVGIELQAISSEVIVENGGDIYLNCNRERIISVYAGKESPRLPGLGIKISPDDAPIGVASSSGKLGRSLSWGISDVAVVLASDPIVADGAATALANRVYAADPSVIESAGSFILNIPGIIGYLIICGKLVSTGGNIKIVAIQ